MFTISPYKYNGTWVFDDLSKGISKELFINGSDGIFEYFYNQRNQYFELKFSDKPFPECELIFNKKNQELDGYWYSCCSLRMSGWLCPVILKYYGEAPERLFVQFKYNP